MPLLGDVAYGLKGLKAQQQADADAVQAEVAMMQVRLLREQS